jgi:hypothetical protein
LVQSKWSSDGSGSIDVASVLKFIQGIRHVLQGDFEALGPKMKKRKQEITEVLGDSSATFVLVIAYTGKAAPSSVMDPKTWTEKKRSLDGERH